MRVWLRIENWQIEQIRTTGVSDWANGSFPNSHPTGLARFPF